MYVCIDTHTHTFLFILQWIFRFVNYLWIMLSWTNKYLLDTLLSFCVYTPKRNHRIMYLVSEPLLCSGLCRVWTLYWDLKIFSFLAKDAVFIGESSLTGWALDEGRNPLSTAETKTGENSLCLPQKPRLGAGSGEMAPGHTVALGPQPHSCKGSVCSLLLPGLPPCSLLPLIFPRFWCWWPGLPFDSGLLGTHLLNTIPPLLQLAQVQFFSVQFSRSAMSDSLRPHESQHTRPPCPSPTPRVYSNSCPRSRWCHPAISPSVVPFSPPPSIFPSIRVFSSESPLHIRWPKYWSFSFSISPSNEYSGLISFRMDWLDLLAVQGTLKSLLQHHSPKASILWCAAFFMVQLSHPYMTIGKTIALTRLDRPLLAK